jgi:hypothetical protein
MIIRLNEQLKTISGHDYLGADGEPVTFKNASIICCEMYKPEKMIPGRVLKVLAIGTKIFNTAGEDIDINDEEIKILKEVIEENKIFVAGLTGELLKRFE